VARNKGDQYPDKNISSSKKNNEYFNKPDKKDPHKPKQEPKPRVKEEYDKSISSRKKDNQWSNPKDNKKKDWAHEDPNKPKPKPKDGGYPNKDKPIGGSKVPSKPGPKKPMTPAAKNLQRTASRSK
jgi:hypothetical protein